MMVMMSEFMMTCSEPEPKCAGCFASLLFMATVFCAMEMETRDLLIPIRLTHRN